MSAAVTVEWEGMRELIEQLRNMPGDLTDDARSIVIDSAEGAKDEAASNYPRRSGTLADALTVETTDAGRFGVAARVRNRARHAYLFEVGTQARHTSIGANRGSMPAGNVFVPAMQRHRREMYRSLAAVLTTYNLQVIGDGF